MCSTLSSPFEDLLPSLILFYSTVSAAQILALMKEGPASQLQHLRFFIADSLDNQRLLITDSVQYQQELTSAKFVLQTNLGSCFYTPILFLSIKVHSICLYSCFVHKQMLREILMDCLDHDIV
ncbi:hypothetical protein OSB04_012214 [Centaurea solstitialis]|uniref:Uncharacterized protein n=1 Tax=Centaurea solstitialis TaxID=347529 RepID=A0AA38WM88_9ASTR|nr:hypothetical protein OSB04_012214 [Centaurea solstitialis]